MPKLTTHHDGHGLTEGITVESTDDIGPGGARHRYEFWADDGTDYVGFLHFQKGPRYEEGSIPGVVEGAVLAVLIDRLEAFQSGPYPCEENKLALEALKSAAVFIKERAHNRANRGVLGLNKV